MEYKGTTKVYHFAEVLYREVGIEGIKAKITNPLSYQVAAFYGCHFLKPSNIKGVDDPEDPKILDELIEATGAKSMPRKRRCCAAEPEEDSRPPSETSPRSSPRPTSRT